MTHLSGDAASANEGDGLLAERESSHAERELLLLREHSARCEAEGASRAKDQFLAMLGHELLNPLAPIVTALQLLRLGSSIDIERARTIIEKHVRHLTSLIDELLDISRITQGRIVLQRKPIELSAVVERAIEISFPLIEQRHQHLSVDVPRQGLLLDADPARLAQAIANLLDNAAKYSALCGRIVVSAAAVDGRVKLSIADSGIGIAAQTLPYVFDIFTQERQASDRALGGLGLGLAIARNLVELHGGKVSAISEGVGTGSTFTIDLPEVISDAPKLQEAVPTIPPARTASEARRVLIVDDNTDAAELLEMVMTGFGCVTRVAHTGPAALALLETFQPELALLDIGLPGMDGYELAQKLRERPDTASIRLVAITGYGQSKDVQRAFAAGFDEHLVKPVDIRALERLLSRLPSLVSVAAAAPLARIDAPLDAPAIGSLRAELVTVLNHSQARPTPEKI